MKVLQLVLGRIKEFATPTVSAGAADAGKIPGLDANGKLDLTFMPTGIGPNTKVLPATEALVIGDMVNVYSNAGVISVRKADATSNAKMVHGFVLAAFASGANATVYTGGINPNQTGLTIGLPVYLSATAPGKGTNTVPSTAGHIVQQLGVATSATEMLVEIDQEIELA